MVPDNFWLFQKKSDLFLKDIFVIIRDTGKNVPVSEVNDKRRVSKTVEKSRYSSTARQFPKVTPLEVLTLTDILVWAYLLLKKLVRLLYDHCVCVYVCVRQRQRARDREQECAHTIIEAIWGAGVFSLPHFRYSDEFNSNL